MGSFAPTWPSEELGALSLAAIPPWLSNHFLLPGRPVTDIQELHFTDMHIMVREADIERFVTYH